MLLRLAGTHARQGSKVLAVHMPYLSPYKGRHKKAENFEEGVAKSAMQGRRMVGVAGRAAHVHRRLACVCPWALGVSQGANVMEAL